MKGYIIGKFDNKTQQWSFHDKLFDNLDDVETKINQKTFLEYEIFESNLLTNFTDLILDGMHLTDYKHGLLLTTDTSDERWGTPYLFGKQYDGGWWNSKVKGWFFRMSSLDELIEWGAKYSSDRRDSLVETDSHEDSETDEDVDLTGMTLKSYGMGYMLKPNKGSHLSGTHYLFGKEADSGWWNKTAKGWFFKSSWFDYLVDLGAALDLGSPKTKTKGKPKSTPTPLKKCGTKGGADVLVEQHSDLSGMKLQPSGKGLLLTTKKTDPVYSVPYLFGPNYDGGWWVPSLCGWFFKISDESYLQELGASFSGSKSSVKHSPKKSSYLAKLVEQSKSHNKLEHDHDFSNMNFYKYGNAWVLQTNRKDPRNGTKYLLGKDFGSGWWNETLKGWIFRKSCKDDLTSRGAVYNGVY